MKVPLSALSLALFVAVGANAAPLRVGVTLHPYASWAENVVAGTDITVVPILPGDIDVDAYRPRAEDVARLKTLDVVVRNGLGHDAFLDDMIKAAGNPSLVVIDINAETATLPEAHGRGRNSHTFLSITNAVQQTHLLARLLGQHRPQHAAKLQENAAAYAKKLRRMLAATQQRLVDVTDTRVVTVHDGYGYLLQELGLELVGVVEPAHGLLPSAQELAAMVELVKAKRVRVVFAESSFPQSLAQPLVDVGARTFVLSHIATGPYRADRFEVEMQKNLDTIVTALRGEP